MKFRSIVVTALTALWLASSAHAGMWDDIKEKSGELKDKVVTEENKETAKEFVEDNKDEIKEWAEDAGKSTKDFFKKL